MIPFMYSNLKRMLWNILNLFVKQVIDKCSMSIQLKEIYIHKEDNLVREKASNWALQPFALRKKDAITNTDIERLCKDCTILYAQLVEKFMKRTPLGSIIVGSSQVLNPNALIMMSAEDAGKKYKSLVTHLIGLKYVSPIFSNKAMNQFTNFVRESRLHQEIFLKFNQE